MIAPCCGSRGKTLMGSLRRSPVLYHFRLDYCRALEAIAANRTRRDKGINIRISIRDLLAVQSRASEQADSLSNTLFKHRAQVCIGISEGHF